MDLVFSRELKAQVSLSSMQVLKSPVSDYSKKSYHVALSYGVICISVNIF